MFVQVDCPAGRDQLARSKRTRSGDHYLLTDEEASVTGVFAVNGYSYGGTGQTSGTVLHLL